MLFKLRLWFLAIFATIALPTVYLLHRSYGHLWVEAHYAYKENAYLLLQLINRRIYDDLEVEEKRSYSEYRFIKAVRVIGGEEVTLSELARWPVVSHWPGIVGYFQMDPDGSLRMPVLPDGLLERIPIRDREAREALRDSVRKILLELGVKHGSVLRRVSAQAMEFTLEGDSLQPAHGNRNEAPFRKRYEKASQKEAIVFDVESEAISERAADAKRQPTEDGGILDVEIDPFQCRFNKGYVAFYRNVWRNEERFIQGFVIDLQSYFRAVVTKDLGVSPNDPALEVEFVANDSVIAHFGPTKELDGTELLSAPLQFPLNDMEFRVKAARVQQPPGAVLIWGLGIMMFAILLGGMLLLYKLVSTQMRISVKRQDFISAVSHELKTPLTAIRMYAELLQNAWVSSEEKRRRYYDMILGESERLSRLIQNVLSLSTLERHRWRYNPQQTNPKIFLEEFAQKFGPTVERAGFQIELKMDPCEFEIPMDRDACSQILVNLMDNAIKFSTDFEPKKVELRLSIRGGDIRYGVRDFGPGIPPHEIGRVFDEFYRVENEMTRRTKGTGLGLSLVKQLCRATGMKPFLQNQHPGLAVEIRFPAPWL